MENQPMKGTRPTNPRRKTRSKMQIFKEVYLPILILAAALLVIVGIVLGIASIFKDPGDPSDGSQSVQLQQEATALLDQAQQLALSYDFDAALETLATFHGNLDQFPEVAEAIDRYTSIKQGMVAWTSDQVPILSFHVLLDDLMSALEDPTYGQNGTNQYNRNFVTTDEFTVILQRLYDNGYVLVDLDDFYITGYSNSKGSDIFFEKKLMLPVGKKPIILTETHCNYYSYMVDLNQDGEPDKDGAGFASKLCWNNGFYNQQVKEDGSTVTGAFDLVPLLENFISLHPDFSYKGARAILAFSGYDGIFGYRINSDKLSADALEKERSDATVLLTKLREAGYTMACYTYRNVDYSIKSASEIKKDIELWQQEIAPIVGQTDILVFAQEADIGTNYKNNEKFDVLYEGGFRFFLGSSPFLSRVVDEDYVRHNRLSATASALQHHSDWFANILDTTALLNPLRGDIPK